VLTVVGQKTGWEDAPAWAEWLASNTKGLSQWFEDKPIWDNDIEIWDASTEDGRYKFAGKLAKGKELLQRPKHWDFFSVPEIPEELQPEPKIKSKYNSWPDEMYKQDNGMPF
jgi:hypothetical protein